MTTLQDLGISTEDLVLCNFSSNISITKGLAVDIFHTLQKCDIPLKKIIPKVFHKLSGETINTDYMLVKLRRTSLEITKLRGDKRNNEKMKPFCIPTSTATSPTCDSSKSQLRQSDVLPEAEIGKQQALGELLMEAQYVNKELKSKLKKTEIKLKERRTYAASLYKRADNVKLKYERLLKRKLASDGAKSDAKQTVSGHVLEIKKMKCELARSKKANAKLEAKVVSQRATFKEKLKTVQKKGQVGHQIQDNDDQYIMELQQKLDSVTKSCNELEISCQYLESLVQDNAELSLYNEDEQCFTPTCTECIMGLLTHGVSSANVSKVIKTVCNLCGKLPNRLPSRQTVDSINRQRLAVAHVQVEESFRQVSGATLYTDETSKKGCKYTVYATTSGDGDDKQTLVLGLQELVSKSAQDTLKGLTDIVGNIANVCSQENLGAEIVAAIKNTMSDRAATEKLFNRLLETYRASLLPSVVDKWDTLSPAEQSNCKKMNNFFCGLHLTVAMADTFCVAVKSLESDMQPLGASSHDDTKMFVKQSETAVERFIRSTCKMCVRGADEKSGCPAFSTYLQMVGKRNMLVEFAHNRFNVLFYDGGEVFALLEDIQTYITTYHTAPNPTNALIKAVLYDSREHWCVAGAKALGLLSKYFTSPLWRILEDSSVSIAEMDKVYENLTEFCGSHAVSEAVTNFMTGQDIPSQLRSRVIRDPTLECLIQDSECDVLVNKILCEVFKKFKDMFVRLVSDHLPGGQHYQMGNQLRDESASVIKHNKICEEMFGHLDRLVRIRPNATVLTNESHLVFMKNRTAEWLSSKPDKEKSQILKESRKNANKLLKLFHERQAVIQQGRVEYLREKEKKAAERIRKTAESKEKYTSDMIAFGLWQSPTQARERLNMINKESEKREALKAQLNFRRHVLLQPVSDKKLYQFSSKALGVYSSDQLIHNLCVILSDMDTSIPEDSSSFLVGNTILHKFVVDGEEKIYKGSVISQVPGYGAWFNIKYEDDPAIYTYKLLEDMADGDLVLESRYQMFSCTATLDYLREFITCWILLLPMNKSLYLV